MAVEATAEFHWADYLVLSIMLVISTAIGFYAAFRKGAQRTTSDYLMGGRKLQWFPVSMSVLASFLSAVSVLGTPLEVYIFGSSFMLYSLAFVVSIPITAHVFIPFFYKLKLTSVYEYLELRFNRIIRLLGSMVFSLQMVFYMAIVLYAPAIALSQVTNLSMLVSVLGIGVICTIYTSLGGLRAVVYTDTFQVIIILLGIATLITKGVVDVGGPGEVFDADPTVRHTFWGLSLGGGVTALSLYAINQALVQRYMAVSKLSHAQGIIYINLPANAFMTTTLCLLGLVAYARYMHCDPFVTRRIKKFDQLIPLMVMDVLGEYPGLPGLFVACVFSAALSTVSSGVNALALVYLEDVAKPTYSAIRHTDMPDHLATVVSKCLAVAFGLVTIGMAYLTGTMDQTLVNITLKSFGMTGGPLLGVFLLAMFFPCANSWGAGVGLLCGLSFSFWMGIGAILDGPKPSILRLTPVDCLKPVSDVMGNTTTTMTSTTLASMTSAMTNFTTQAPASVSARVGYNWIQGRITSDTESDTISYRVGYNEIQGRRQSDTGSDIIGYRVAYNQIQGRTQSNTGSDTISYWVGYN
ncbi:hypothetical protein BaRGS_00025727 [Batillaria attramentaria]|uniref:Sodium-dependent multivitamin transporter n=1 Tax=Batillaria attramentaria TaxID=370345 RepID=A0ABD0K759_9CAEN